MQLSVSTKSPVTHIFHFADIHIRNGDVDRARYEEYRHVFENTCKQLEKHSAVQKQTALIVIAGDVFHHKGKIDTPALKLYFEWMDRMLTFAPVIMICGNHDFRQEDPRHPDMLETVVIQTLVVLVIMYHTSMRCFMDQFVKAHYQMRQG